ncbi:DinB family protein [Paludisphaera soli]|uniref:DinB family protein n=1 Tax=Paludisphaera soli TaxID=2712865 RepID=UPI0013EAEB94|nr:DinB family protein [Paludisphaera soli]
MSDPVIRDVLARSLAWSEAHLNLDEAVGDLPEPLRGIRPERLPHSPWELLEHIRIVQRDILDFSLDGTYRERGWPQDYWPSSPAPPDAEAWDRSIAALIEDREKLQALVQDAKVELAAVVPHGSDQTYIREVLLVLDHTAYHVGQLVVVRKLLGAWVSA